MTQTKRILIGVFLSALVLQAPYPHDVPGHMVQGPCTEDMSCWDCRTMGNEVCGHDLRPG